MRERARKILKALFYGAMETPGEAYISTTLHKRDELNDDEEQLLIGGDGWDDFESFFSWIFEIIEDRYYEIGMDHEYRQEFVTDEEVENELIEELEEWKVKYIEED
jgi:hypothetical protein